VVVAAEPLHGVTHAARLAHKVAKVVYARNAARRDGLPARQTFKAAWHGETAWTRISALATESRRPKPRPLLRSSSKATRDKYNVLLRELLDGVAPAAAAPAVPAGMAPSAAPSGPGLTSTTEGGFVPQHDGAVPQLLGRDECPATVARTWSRCSLLSEA
jgi:hypothetical protein